MDPLDKIRHDLIKINNDKSLELKYIKVVCPCCKNTILNSDKLLIHMNSKQHKKYLKNYLDKQKDNLNLLSNILEIV